MQPLKLSREHKSSKVDLRPALNRGGSPALGVLD